MVTAYSEERRGSAAGNPALLSGDKRRQHADALLRYSLNEDYHPDTGAALSHKGFMNWNLLVLEMI